MEQFKPLQYCTVRDKYLHRNLITFEISGQVIIELFNCNRSKYIGHFVQLWTKNSIYSPSELLCYYSFYIIYLPWRGLLSMQSRFSITHTLAHIVAHNSNLVFYL